MTPSKVDNRTRKAKRFRTVLARLLEDCGGDRLSEGARQLVARCATISAELERQEQIVAAGGEIDFMAFGQLTDRLGRTLARVDASLGEAGPTINATVNIQTIKRTIVNTRTVASSTTAPSPRGAYPRTGGGVATRSASRSSGLPRSNRPRSTPRPSLRPPPPIPMGPTSPLMASTPQTPIGSASTKPPKPIALRKSALRRSPILDRVIPAACMRARWRQAKAPVGVRSAA